MLKLKDNLVKMWGEGIELKRKHDAILTEKERPLNGYRIMEIEKDALNVYLIIMEGEKNDFEAWISQIDSRDSAANQQVEELKTRVEELVKEKESLVEKLELVEKKR